MVLTLLPALLVLTDGLVIEKKWKGSRRRIRERYVTRRQQFHERAEQIRTKLEEHRNGFQGIWAIFGAGGQECGRVFIPEDQLHGGTVRVVLDSSGSVASEAAAS